MPFSRSVMRYGHGEGFTTVSYEENGEKHISVGPDGDIRIWDGIHDDDPSTTCVAEFVIAILQYSDRVLIATEVNTVQILKYPSLSKDGILFRFTAYATCLAKNDKYIAAGSEDATIQVAKIDKSIDSFELNGPEAPILNIDISTKDLLAASSGDGTIRVWDLKTKAVVKVINEFGKVKSLQSVVHFSSPSFDPNTGELMAYPKGKQIVIMDTMKWTVTKTVKDNVSGDFTFCAFSPLGDYLAAGTDQGEVTIWHYKTGKVLEGEKVTIDSKPITRVVWSPKNNGELAVTDSDGHVGVVQDAFIEEEENLDFEDPVELAEKKAEHGIDYDNDDDFLKYQDADDDDDNENCIAIGKLKNDLLKFDENSNDKNAADDVPDDTSSIGSIMQKSYPMQTIFQPGATPDYLEHYYFVYNHVGTVRCHKDGIDAEFHDSQLHHGLHTSNIMNHTMGALSEDVFALATGLISPSQGSKLVCLNLVAFGNRQWEYILPKDEEIIGLTASDNIIVAATSKRFLRIFSTKGTQREIVSVPGPIVALAAFGNKVIVAYHNSPATNDQHLNVMLITCTDFMLRCRDMKLPLSPDATLTWFGYSDKGSPVSFDSDGILRLYHWTSSLWFPIYDAQEQMKRSNNLFIVQILESTQKIQAIICRGSKFPLTTPKPIPTEIPFKLPVCDETEDKSNLEESLVRSLYFKVNDSDKLIKENFIKLFALTCRSEMELRAKELVEMIASPQILPLAAKYATKLGRLHLSDKIMEMLPVFQEKENAREKESVSMEEEVTVEEKSFANNSVSSIIVAKNETTPVIVPKPLEISQRKNPFKKTGLSGNANSSSKRNPLKHLTGKAIGFSTDNDEAHSIEGITPLEEPTLAENNENKNSNTPKNKFLAWFDENKDSLKFDNPDASEAELLKIGMRVFKASNIKTPTNKPAEKRKLDDSDKHESSGINKLAKFGFVKN